ncbi:type III secretion protein [Paraburkholderia strydomiana]|uniref:type III secretion protein n=1 Tax=Paraburkholderia strydomiana TaxID=1245417 RepID=UPI001BE94098|nr:type III secretion protein [Paraburkholderia strydomiana]MBT2793420.1 type III secretion protein [Paraburkholderia strydomiana]
MSAQRQITALKRSGARRERLDEALRGALAQRQNERAACYSQADAAAQRHAELEAVVRMYRQRIAAMMTGAEPFSIDNFTSIRRYTETVEERLAHAQSELNEARAAIAAKDEEIAAARRDIAQNRGRIDMCEQRVKKLEAVLDGIAADAEDEETEEMALARLGRK